MNTTKKKRPWGGCYAYVALICSFLKLLCLNISSLNQSDDNFYTVCQINEGVTFVFVVFFPRMSLYSNRRAPFIGSLSLFVKLYIHLFVLMLFSLWKCFCQALDAS